MPEVTTLIPPRMAALPRDKHHRPVPWFVAFVDGQPDHRLIGPGKIRAAVSGMRCWLCGQRLGPNLAFATAKVTKAERDQVQSGAPADDPWAASANPQAPAHAHAAAGLSEEPPF